MEQIKSIATEARNDIEALLGASLQPQQAQQVARIIERAVIKAVLEGQHRAVDACVGLPEAEQDTAHRIAAAIRRSNDALIANLVSLR